MTGIGIPPGFVRDRAVDHAVVQAAQLAHEQQLDDDATAAVRHALIEAFYAGATSIAAELRGQLAEVSDQGRLRYRDEDGEWGPLIGHLHIAEHDQPEQG
jgi:hypothetical protein